MKMTEIQAVRTYKIQNTTFADVTYTEGGPGEETTLFLSTEGRYPEWREQSGDTSTLDRLVQLYIKTEPQRALLQAPPEIFGSMKLLTEGCRPDSAAACLVWVEGWSRVEVHHFYNDSFPQDMSEEVREVWWVSLKDLSIEDYTQVCGEVL